MSQVPRLVAVSFTLLVGSSIAQESVDSKISCSGLLTEFVPTSREGVIRSNVTFEVSEIGQRLVIMGIVLPYTSFPLTAKTDDMLISNSTDQKGNGWLVNIERYTGRFYLAETMRKDLPSLSGEPMVIRVISPAFCKKIEKVL